MAMKRHLLRRRQRTRNQPRKHHLRRHQLRSKPSPSLSTLLLRTLTSRQLWKVGLMPLCHVRNSDTAPPGGLLLLLLFSLCCVACCLLLLLFLDSVRSFVRLLCTASEGSNDGCPQGPTFSPALQRGIGYRRTFILMVVAVKAGWLTSPLLVFIKIQGNRL